MDFSKSLAPFRQYNSNVKNNPEDWLMQFESDRGRIINSAPVRRLQQKTQVFPLELNAAVRSRLTHSLEVQQVGRFLVQTIFRKLKAGGQLDVTGLTALERSLESVVEMSCLMHDIGNPPFGHFGEQAITDWFKQNIPHCLQQINAKTDGVKVNLSDDLLRDVSEFEGNAQAIRLITSLQQLNLSFPQIASILKYTRCGTEKRPQKDHALYEIKKKVGYYYSELSLVSSILEKLDIARGHRHPAAYIMEAADDISYCIADLEDAVEKNIISIEVLSQALQTEYDKLLVKFKVTEPKYTMAKIIKPALRSAQIDDQCNNSQFFIQFRLKIIHPLVQHASQRFVDNLEAVCNGSLGKHLLEDKSEFHCLVKTLKTVASKHVFNDVEVEANELKGYKILTGILECYSPLLKISRKRFSDLANGEGDILHLRLYKKIPNKHLRAYSKVTAEMEDESLEFYYRCRLMQDMVSGMTDHFAQQEYRALMAVD